MTLSKEKMREIEEEENYRKEVKNKISNSKSKKKDKLVAALLAIILGDLGIHKFYIGETVKGVIYLFFCWTAIPAIIGIIEGIDYLIISEEEFQSRCKYK